MQLNLRPPSAMLLRYERDQTWRCCEIPIAEFYRLADGSHPQEGDHFTWMDFAVAGANGPVYFDDIELVEVQK